ncbi:hypothetical protein EIP91_002716 [Steccherinum ochraceum]|uniref:Arrestin-like N-terminal domain-containing protein n=1 Tax=Steccherinum ochraceum TaxID=92696 RepID=A0A4V2MW94_9APHY|nr:hypothetical protein EIP91_002716 [Steccherinum ochraceum]
MSHTDLPPLYSHHSYSAEPTTTAHPVPVYTERAHTTERVLHRSSSEPEAASRTLDGIGTREYKYKTDTVEINLGPCPWGLLYCAYGRCGAVKGLVTFLKKGNGILQVTATLRGAVTVTTTEHTMVASVAKRTFLSQTVTLFQAEVASTIQPGTPFPFNLPFPENATTEDFSLPPSVSIFHPGASAEISYTVQVDIVRSKFYRHEMRAIPLLYLPKSSPQHPPLPEMPLVYPGNDIPGGMRKVALNPVWPSCATQEAKEKDLATVQALFPEPPEFASGETIPLALYISCPNSPAIPKLLSDNIGVFLIKRKKVWINEGRHISIREIIVEKVKELRVNSMLEGVLYLTMDLQAGEHGAECSWGIPGYMTVEYVVRIIVRPPAYASHLPVYKCDEVIRICTDSYGRLSRELLTMDGTPMPALGLTNLLTSPAALRLHH